MSLPDVQIVEHPAYRTITPTGLLGGHQPMHFEMVLYHDEIKADDALASLAAKPERTIIKRTLESRLFLDPFAAKVISVWLNQHIADYEKIFGIIPSPEEVNIKMSQAAKKDLR